MGFTVEQVRIRRELRIKSLIAVGFVRNFADDLLQDIFQRQQPHRGTVLVDHDRHVDLTVPELLEQFVDFLVLRHEIRLADQILPLEIPLVRDIRQHIFYI